MEAVFHGPGFVAAHQSFIYGDEYVEPVPITQEELRPTQDDQFVVPAGKGWEESSRILSQPGVLVVLGEAGTGRGTAALYRLRRHCSPDQLIRLETSWERPNARLLPTALGGFGYLLDMSEYSKSPAGDFGMALRNWAAQSGAYLVVLISYASTNDEWLRSLADRVVRLRTPDAKQLVAHELRVADAHHLVERLDDTAFTEIWQSEPRASEALRLKGILLANPTSDSSKIADEFLGWKNWFTDKCPTDFGQRTLVWSAALCDGGRRTSVLAMSEALRAELGESRSLFDIFSDAFASQQLSTAHIHEGDDHVQLDPKCHGLPTAVRLHLWREFAGYRQTLTTWAIDQTKILNVNDARRVVQSLMELAVHYRDHALIQQLFDALSARRPQLLVEALSKGALDPVVGAYIRGRLYVWLAHRPTQEVVNVVASVCGGEFGQVKPSMAITRLGRAAHRSPNPISPPLVEAFTSIGTSQHREKLLQTIWRWFDAASTERAGVSAFLCLASTERGISVLCGEDGHELADHAARETLARGFQKAIAREDTYRDAVAAMKLWKEATVHGMLDRNRVSEIFGAAVRPNMKFNIIIDLAGGDGMKEFVDEVLTYAIHQPERHTRAVEMKGPDDVAEG